VIAQAANPNVRLWLKADSFALTTYSNRKINDWERTSIALKGIEGKRLTYRRVA